MNFIYVAGDYKINFYKIFHHKIKNLGQGMCHSNLAPYNLHET